MAGRTCLVTGATSGIGKATATALARLGADLVLVARDRAKGEATVTEIETATGNPRIELLVADLASQASLRGLAEEYQERHDRLHVLVNNAGGYWATRHSTVDGLELTFARNHLAYFLLTNLLLEVLVASAPARIVNVTSGAQAVGDIHFDDLQSERRYRGQAVYNQSKLANVLFTYELARRLDGSGVTVNCAAPGVTRTNFGRDDSGRLMRMLSPLVRPFMRTPEQGADTLLYLATSRHGGRDRQVLREPARETVLQAVLRHRPRPAAVAHQRGADRAPQSGLNGVRRLVALAVVMLRRRRPVRRQAGWTSRGGSSSSPTPGARVSAFCKFVWLVT